MNNSLKKFQAWRSRRRSRRERCSLQQWEQIRVEGKTRFVRRTALTYGLTYVGLTDVYQRVIYGETESLILLKLIFFVLFGVLMQSSIWSDMESKYKKDLLEARANQHLPDSKTSP